MKKRSDKLTLIIVFLGFLTLILENAAIKGRALNYISHIIDFVIFIIFSSEILLRFIKAKSKKFFLKHNFLEVIFVVSFLTFFIASKYYHFFIEEFQ